MARTINTTTTANINMAPIAIPIIAPIGNPPEGFGFGEGSGTNEHISYNEYS